MPHQDTLEIVRQERSTQGLFRLIQRSIYETSIQLQLREATEQVQRNSILNIGIRPQTGVKMFYNAC